MRESDFQLLFWVAVVAVVILGLMYFAMKSRYYSLSNDYQTLRLHMNERVQQEFNVWRDRELGSERAKLSQAADAQAVLSLEAWKIQTEKEIRKDAIDRAAAVLSGKVTEHVAPYLPDFPYDPRDVRFLGAPVDLIVFDGMSENDLREIVFLEVKTGSSSLTKRERRIRDAVQEKRVSWEVFHLETQEDSSRP
jgi:predicted Holliday junction resolvase-like endonuclease